MNNSAAATNPQRIAEIKIMRQAQAIAEAIRELKQVPSGHLYAQVMNHLSFAEYENITSILERGKIIRRDPSGLLTWILPPKVYHGSENHHQTVSVKYE